MERLGLFWVCSGFARGYAATSWVYFGESEITIFFIMTVYLPVEMTIFKIAQINMIEK
jgi:hypothetical protein